MSRSPDSRADTMEVALPRFWRVSPPPFSRALHANRTVGTNPAPERPPLH